MIGIGAYLIDHVVEAEVNLVGAVCRLDEAEVVPHGLDHPLLAHGAGREHLLDLQRGGQHEARVRCGCKEGQEVGRVGRGSEPSSEGYM